MITMYLKGWGEMGVFSEYITPNAKSQRKYMPGNLRSKTKDI